MDVRSCGALENTEYCAQEQRRIRPRSVGLLLGVFLTTIANRAAVRRSLYAEPAPLRVPRRPTGTQSGAVTRREGKTSATGKCRRIETAT